MLARQPPDLDRAVDPDPEKLWGFSQFPVVDGVLSVGGVHVGGPFFFSLPLSGGGVAGLPSAGGDFAGFLPQGGGAVFNDAAIEAVKQWLNRPCLVNGQPAEIQTTITVNFRLQ